MIKEDVAEILRNNPQITTAIFTCYPNEKDLFWRGFKSACGCIAAGLFCFSLIAVLSAILAWMGAI